MIASNLAKVRSNLARLSEEVKHPVRLIAVSKTMPVEVLMEAYDAGQRRFGENYVHEILEKAPMMPADVEWHMIGTVQSNKIKQLAQIPNLACIESLSSEKTAKVLNEKWGERWKGERKLWVMVQVNTSAEESKDGVEPSECFDLVRFVSTKCPHLSFRGLMTIGKLGDATSTCFDMLRELRDDVISRSEKEAEPFAVPSAEEFELSMGMSGDYELAVRCGSTNVRVGSTIFGARAKKPPVQEERQEEGDGASSGAKTGEVASKGGDTTKKCM